MQKEAEKIPCKIITLYLFKYNYIIVSFISHNANYIYKGISGIPSQLKDNIKL